MFKLEKAAVFPAFCGCAECFPASAGGGRAALPAVRRRQRRAHPVDDRLRPVGFWHHATLDNLDDELRRLHARRTPAGQTVHPQNQKMSSASLGCGGNGKSNFPPFTRTTRHVSARMAHAGPVVILSRQRAERRCQLRPGETTFSLPSASQLAAAQLRRQPHVVLVLDLSGPRRRVLEHPRLAAGKNRGGGKNFPNRRWRADHPATQRPDAAAALAARHQRHRARHRIHRPARQRFHQTAFSSSNPS